MRKGSQMGIRKKKWIEIKCINCGKVFEVTPARKDVSKFCSHSCSSTYNIRNKIAGFKNGHGKLMSDEKYKENGNLISASKIGKKLSEKHKLALSICKSGKPRPWARGENSPMWKGGTGRKLSQLIRQSLKYAIWRSDTFRRDNFTCQECGQIGGYLEVHHIDSFIEIVERNNITTLEQAENCNELWDISNGKTLCKKCHKKTNNYGRRKSKDRG